MPSIPSRNYFGNNSQETLKSRHQTFYVISNFTLSEHETLLPRESCDIRVWTEICGLKGTKKVKKDGGSIELTTLIYNV